MATESFSRTLIPTAGMRQYCPLHNRSSLFAFTTTHLSFNHLIQTNNSLHIFEYQLCQAQWQLCLWLDGWKNSKQTLTFYSWAATCATLAHVLKKEQQALFGYSRIRGGKGDMCKLLRFAVFQFFISSQSCKEIRWENDLLG